MAGLYAQKYSPARAPSPHHHHLRSNNNISTPSAAASSDVDSQYLSELLGEHQKLAPFTQVLPICSRLLNQEILRVSGMFTNQQGCFTTNFDRMHPLSDINPPNFRGTHLGAAWNTLPLPLPLPDDRLGGPPQGIMDWQSSPNSNIAKRILRLEIPLDTYPTLQFNFVGRLLGPRGNSLKRVEASTGCRVFIRGKGSIKDADKEETLRGRPGYEHLNDPLHILIEAELPVTIVDIRLRQAKEIIQELLKPVEESHDFYKRQQLRELAMLNSNIREESPQPRTSISPFSSSGMKRAKTGQ